MSANETDGNSARGIDFQLALSILSQRTSEARTHEHDDHACPCQAPPTATDAVQKMGQVLHLDDTTSTDGAATINEIGDNVTPNSSTKNNAPPPANPLQAKPHHFIEAFRSLSTRQLLQAVLSAQQDRVAAYHEYNQGLQAILSTNHVGYYPTVCTDATAKFAVIGDTMNAAQATLKQRSETTDNPSLMTEIRKLINSLQKHEQQKLQYTAAWHLEQIRLHQTAEDDRTSKQLLQDSTRTLQHKLAACVEQINDVIEELQCALIEAPCDDNEAKEKE